MAGNPGYNNRPLVAGTIVGHKWMMPDGAVNLWGPTYPQLIEPGENLARCARTQNALNPYRIWNIFKDRAYEGRKMAFTYGNSPDHPIPLSRCGCGWWAYTASHHIAGYANGACVLGVIEGYGKCLVGPLGFRAEKMRVVALARPQGTTQVWRNFGTVRTAALLDALAEKYEVPLYENSGSLREDYPLRDPNSDVSIF